MHWLDFVLILVFGVGGLLGLRSGLLWQVARIVIFAAAIYCCINYHEIPARWLKDNFEGLNEGTSWLAAYVVTFLGVCLVGFLITYALECFLRAANLKPVDRLLGAVFGVLKAALVCGGVLTGFALYGSPQMREAIGDSYIAPPLLEGMKVVLAAIPEKIKEDLSESLEKIKQHSADKLRPSQDRGGDKPTSRTPGK